MGEGNMKQLQQFLLFLKEQNGKSEAKETQNADP